ncbi:MAG: urea carboxylase-associated protein 2 [Bradyrhizobium sp.]|jgi:uncharacterized protein YcgI (DUF1989 family)|nr:urea carboxylase-associated protein 2 [Bradyrhizobium sp.]MEA2869938.1 uncharacterized protein [Bradyrhizobium sp.]
MTTSPRKTVHELTIEPGTGKALELRRGQVLRIEQTSGRQCADFNCFNLHDYKEFFHTGRTRHLHGLHPTKGDFLWSAPPRERPMMAIIEDTVGTNDVLYPRCSGFLFEYQYGLPVHTNCHDIQAEAQREFGLTPDDVHDSFNFFMHTGVDATGHPYIAKNTAERGDYVELLALMDVLAVPNVCGADVMMTSDFELKPLKLTIFEGTDHDWSQISELPRLKSQRGPADFKVKNIKADRELYRDTGYRPEFANVPLRISELEVKLTAEEFEWVEQLKATGKYGESDAEVLRYVFFTWWIGEFMRGPKHAAST